MKKISKLTCLLLCLLVVSIIFCSCAKCKDNKHIFEEKMIKEATCKEEGIIQKTCSECGLIKKQSISKKDHNYKEVSFSDATCTVSGKKTLNCSRCGETREEYIEALGHKWVDATCKKAKYCSVCKVTAGGKSGHAYENSVCTVCGKENMKTVTLGAVKIKLPISVDVKNDDYRYIMKVDTIDFDMNVYYSVECIKNPEGYPLEIFYSLYDPEGYVVASGDAYTTDLRTGEKARNQSFTVYGDTATELIAGKTYTLKISGE